MDQFTFRGMYRVQSRRTEVFSEIIGSGYLPSEKLLDSDRVNARLKKNPIWSGKRIVNLVAANIWHRTGLFDTEPDILYKKQFFRPLNDSVAMPCDVVDVIKSIEYWKERRDYNISLFGREGFNEGAALITDLDITIANEYYCHEAGHLLGYDVLSKYNEGYFRVDGRSAWPLIFVEEFRADLHSFGFAADLLPPTLAVQIILYNIFLRFGLAAYSARQGTDGYGSIPYLLFHLLTELGVVDVTAKQGVSQLKINSLAPEYLLEIMRACALHAERELTGIEVSSSDPADMALNAAKYYRRRILDNDRFNIYSQLIQQQRSNLAL